MFERSAERIGPGDVSPEPTPVRMIWWDASLADLTWFSFKLSLAGFLATLPWIALLLWLAYRLAPWLTRPVSP